MIKRKLAVLTVYLLVSVLTLSGCNTTPTRSSTSETPPFQASEPEDPLTSLTQAAEEGDHEAQFQLGELYGNRRDISQAIHWFSKAAEGGHWEAQYTLGLMYDLGIDVTGDVAEATKWYRQAAQQGHRGAQARLCKLSNTHPECIDLLNQLAQEPTGIDLGWSEDLAQAAEAKRKRSLAKLTEAANQGDLEAQYELGNQYRLGGQSDLTETVKWWHAAASAGHINAQYELGKMYQTGVGVPKDTAKATEWYEMAMRQGHTEALKASLELDAKVGGVADQKKRLSQFDAARKQRALEKFGTVGLAVPRFKPVITVRKPTETKGALRSVLGGLFKGTLGGAGFGAQTGFLPIAIGTGVVGALAGTGSGIEEAVENSKPKRLYKNAARQLPKLLSEADIHAGLQNEITRIIKERSSNRFVVSETAGNTVNTVLQVSSFSVTFAGTMLSMRAEGQLRRKTDDTAARKRAMSYSQSVEAQDLNVIVADGYGHFADEMVSHLMDLPELPSLPAVDELPSVDSQDRLRVAFLPLVYTIFETQEGDSEVGDLKKQITHTINNAFGIYLVESNEIEATGLLNQANVWNKQREDLWKPNLDYLYTRGREAELDAVIMASFDFDELGYMMYRSGELYMIDLRHQRVLKERLSRTTGDLKLEKKLTGLLTKAGIATGSAGETKAKMK